MLAGLDLHKHIEIANEKVSRKGAKNAKDAKNAGWPEDVFCSDGLSRPMKTLEAIGA
jgi:hypothetical protein